MTGAKAARTAPRPGADVRSAPGCCVTSAEPESAQDLDRCRAVVELRAVTHLTVVIAAPAPGDAVQRDAARVRLAGDEAEEGHAARRRYRARTGGDNIAVLADIVETPA